MGWDRPMTSYVVTPESAGRVVVVGGSLVGLAAGIALVRRGASVTVLEQTVATGYVGGGGLGVDLGLLAAVTGLRGQPPVCRGSDRDTTAWPLLADWLEVRARGVRATRSCGAAGLSRSAADGPITSDGRRFQADVVIGADGARSTVRRYVSPTEPDATYAGIVLWRAMVAETDLPPETGRLRLGEPSREHYPGPYRLVTYVVPGADGSAVSGRRRLNLVWYDPARTEFLAPTGLLDESVVRGSLTAEEVPVELRDELRAVAKERWPSPWSEALDIAFRKSSVSATPVVEYWPERLVRDQVVIVGDAAHAASPMVGGGIREGLHDVAALSAAYEQGGALSDVLSFYSQRRLQPARSHVERSMAASAHYLARRDEV
jgi:2-polyprenyl-6-methoxyphenol hydroxylase-like FAD-dependent oxidoreductase